MTVPVYQVRLDDRIEYAEGVEELLNLIHLEGSYAERIRIRHMTVPVSMTLRHYEHL